MRKINLFILVFMLSFILISCKNDTSEFSLFLSFNSEQESIQVSLNSNNYEVKQIGILYTNNKDDNLSLDNTKSLKVDVVLNTSNNDFNILIDKIEDYDLKYYIRGYIVLANDKVIYTKKVETSLLALAKKDNNIEAQKIIEDYNLFLITIYEINITVDKQKYIILDHSSNIKVNIKTDYIKVEIEVILDSGFLISNELVFIVNDEIIVNQKLTFEDNKIIYVYDDPNWSDMY